MRSLINILDLSVEEIDALIATSNDIIANPKKYSEDCHGKKVSKSLCGMVMTAVTCIDNGDL